MKRSFGGPVSSLVPAGFLVSTMSLAALAVVAVTGCGAEGPRIIEGTTLRSTYQGMGYECGTIVLNLAPDGGFVMVCAPPAERPCDIVASNDIPDGVQAVRGTWESRGGDLTLTGDGLTLVFAECEVSVDARGETGMLPGLRWVSSSEKTFADSSRLVARGALMEFMHPSQGSGSRTSAL
ncbi:MAG: hypothetical protein ABIG03_00360 [Candidatus Eisenbacteria bacterium]